MTAAEPMHVIATAGHVDHGKSTLVRALTGMDPDRLAEERRRAMTIELGYVWTRLPGAGRVAFVDVPGHERFVPTMLAGVGPVPAVLFVAAADDPWMPQAAEHLAALDALGVRDGVVAVTRTDRADPAPASRAVTAALSGTSLAGAPVVPVSARTGDGLPLLRDTLAALVGRLPAPDPTADVRLWVDRVFTITGAGTVVTGTLPGGRIRVGDELAVDGVPVRVRGLQALGAPAEAVTGPARVALNVGGPGVAVLRRGVALVAPDAWVDAAVLDVRLSTPHGQPEAPLPRAADLHVGAARVPVRLRALGGGLARLTPDRSLPLRVGDRALLRDPGNRRLWGVLVLDPVPPPLVRRGDGRARALVLDGIGPDPDPWGEVDRRGLVHRDLLRRIGAPCPTTAPAGGRLLTVGPWLVSRAHAERLARAVADALSAHDADHPLDPGLSVHALAARLGLPDPKVLAAVVWPPLRVEGGRVVDPRHGGGLPPLLRAALDAWRARVADAPFVAPTADELAELGLDASAIAAAARAGQLVRLAPGVVLPPDAPALAAAWLALLPQPFTVSEARARLGTTRRVAVPLLEHLDRLGVTRRDGDDRRRVVHQVGEDGTPVSRRTA